MTNGQNSRISLTIVGNPRSPAEAWDAAFPAAEFDRSFVAFDEAASPSFRPAADTVIVLFAVPFSDSVADLISAVNRSGCASPILVVVPESGGGDPAELARVLSAADDFAVWPTHPEELRCRIRRLVSTPRDTIQDRVREQFSIATLVGSDPAFLRSISTIPAFARSEAPVLITGETGTGKELCARALHQLSDRRNGPFIAVDCGALPDRLFENEVFGHARGAYTDAHREQKGLAQLADHGTLFLDEIHSLSPSSQNKLLRFVQEKTFRPLGSDRFLKADTKIVTGTNRRLDQMVAGGEFRSDLLFRIDVLRIALPALRDRSSDIEPLANHIVGLLNVRGLNKVRKVLTPAAIRKLTLHAWPGNVRELQNVLERAMVLCEARQILPCHITLGHITQGADEPPAPCASPPSEKMRVARARWIAEFEHDYVETLIRKHEGNVTAAAMEAGKERRAFGRLVQKYRICKTA